MIQQITYNIDPRRIDLPGRVLVAHQAEFMPWLGFISKACMGDLFLILDDTQFKKKYFENRNKIRFSNDNGWLWLTIPIKNKDNLPNMMDVVIANNKWKKSHLNAIATSYSRSKFFEEYFHLIENVYLNFNSDHLVDFNISIIKLAFELFNINIPIIRVSELKTEGYEISGTSTTMIISLCKAVQANILVAGSSGKDYLDIEMLNKNNMKVVFQKFRHPQYFQRHGSFISYMSFLDILFNLGKKEAIRILSKSEYEY